MAPRIVILGGGFAGVTVAQGLQHLLPRDAADITLVSRDNFFLFHPMLPEVGGGSIEAHHILNPIRQLCSRCMVTIASVHEVDLAHKQVVVVHGPHEEYETIPYDFLVVAVGSVTNFSELSGLAQHSLGLKTVGDALYLRNHLITMLEEADGEEDAQVKREMLTFVVAGGGFSGVEMVAELNDFVREAARNYRRVDPRQIKVLLLHSGDRILPELSAGLAEFAQRELQHRQVEIRFKTRLAAATECEAVLEGGEILHTRTLVSTIGTSTNPVLATMDCQKDDRGRLPVTPYLDLPGHPEVWALGDCAVVPNAATGQPSPPTAQFAQRQAKVVAHNLAAAVRGGEREQFKYRSMGQFVSLGHRSAVAEILRFKIAGFPAWFLWRTIYLQKLPTLSRKARVAIDWTLDLLFGRDIVELPLARGERIGRAHFEPGDVIIHQGDGGDLFYVITNGEVEVVRTDADGHEVVLTHLHDGEYFGEVALLRSARRNATVRAVSPVNVLTLGRDDFTVLAKSWAGLRENLHATARAREA